MSVDKAALLKDLRKQVTSLEDDLRDRTNLDQEFYATLHTEYERARQAQRTALTYGQWRDDRVTQAAVAWILATVFVRFCEDNGLIADPWITGPGERHAEADERHQQFFRDHPEQNDRDWLIAAFDHLAETNETVAGLFDRAHNPLWELTPSYEQASALLKFWRRLDADGEIVHDFTDENLDTRFLGDLYQDLSDHAKKTYALLQTPEFVEEFILDLTLEPAVKEFGLEPAWKHKPAGWPGDEPIVRGLRTIDPACGSGHFLLGIFHRLLEKWEDYAPALGRWEHIRRSLESVHGCDKNPFAAEIARFRLLVAALNAAGEKRLDVAPVFPINVAVGDSLLHGRGAIGIQTKVRDIASISIDGQFTYHTEDIKTFSALYDLLGYGSYHVVVGNPPYVTVKDRQEKANYKKAYEDSCSGLWTLAMPFLQRFFELAIRTGGRERNAGFVGQITANAFMKREFGVKVVKHFLPTVDLSHLIDTSGAYIPGHGTPTVILIGRNRIAFQRDPVRTVRGVRGESIQPSDPAQGLVWSAILAQIGEVGSESEWVHVIDLNRGSLATHPWSLSGGGAIELLATLNSHAIAILGHRVTRIGFVGMTHADDLMTAPPRSWISWAGDLSLTRPIGAGDGIRDWSADIPERAFFPYDVEGDIIDLDHSGYLRALWPFRTELGNRSTISGGTYFSEKRPWYGWHQLPRDPDAHSWALVFAFVATDNHFILDREGSLFRQSAPVLKFPRTVQDGEFFDLLGLLNSSAACFWLKQVSHNKGRPGAERVDANEPWENRYEFTGTKLHAFPIPSDSPVRIAYKLDNLGQQWRMLNPAYACASESPIRASLDKRKLDRELIFRRMVALQEEMDWEIYGRYGLFDPGSTEVLLDDPLSVPELNLGERAFEIVLARKLRAGRVETSWFLRHGSRPITEIPSDWPEKYRRVVQARIDLIEQRPRDIGLLERPEYKRRWATEPWEKKEKVALRNRILDRCEREDLWFGLRDGLRHPRTLTVSQLADQFRNDEDMQSVAALYAADHLGMRDLPLAKVLVEVVADEHVPHLAALRYKDTGLRKREEWERVWDLQREEDRTGERLDIAVPPKYAPKDYRKNSYWSQRGKLDVPKERFISYPGASPDSDDTLLLGWAGWDHKDQAQALVNLVNDRTEQAAWDEEKLTPLLAGLHEVMPWVHQWHGEYDDEWEGVPAEEFQSFLDDQRGRYQLSEQDLRAWRPPTKRRGRKKA